MTTQFIYKRLRHLEKNRLIGKPGLSMDQVRESETKVRLTKSENDLLALVINAAAKCRGIRREQARCSLVIDAMTGPVKSGPGISIRTPKSQGWQSLH